MINSTVGFTDPANTSREGIPGPTGPTGPQGPAGADGADALWNFVGEYDNGADYNIGDVVTYSGGTYYRVGEPNPGYPPGTVYWTTIAEPGADGAQGPQGDQGPQGEQGIQGETGPIGPSGPQGDPGVNGTTAVLAHQVKAGEALTKGQAVYVSSADGTNMIVSKASNTIESTSSKTMGLITTNLAHNEHGTIITEGLLAGLNTASANDGDPVWLGTNGNLIYGLSNKPSAPAHLVFIGIVTRANQNNGEIFVKCQNGFEVRELHDAVIESNGSLTDNEVFAYDSASGMWKNKTATEAELQVRVSGVTDTEIGYLDGVTSAIQTQLNNKINTTGTNAISLTSTTDSDPLIIQSKNGHGGGNFAGIQTWINTSTGATNPNKFWRINPIGGLELINSDYTTTLFAITNDGNIGTSGGITAPGGFYTTGIFSSSATTGHVFFRKTHTSNVNTSMGTELSMDNLNVRVRNTGGSNGMLEASAVSGSFSAYVTLWENISGQPARATTNANGITFSAGSWTSVNANHQISAGGDLITYHLMDTTNNRLYRVTCMHGSSLTGAYISIERML